MIEPILGLSFNLQAQKGTYALLLGSGISRSAEIPTGWEVTLDLVRQLAHMEGEDCEDREAEWYEGKYGQAPDYSALLAAIAPTSAAQQQVLRRYFEADEEDREQGRKAPTAAHKAIAQLVASGHIRIIVTTNFDRLMEAALEAIGIAPIVVASSDAIAGMPPLAHTRCTIIKVHGDYLDHRIKNAPEALAKYDKGMNTLLDQVWDEYGLIVCGWSSEYDAALRASIERCKSRRYPMYWVARSELKGTAKALVTLRGAQVVHSAGADDFFASLAEKVAALEEFGRPHPLSVQAAVASLKRYLSEDRYRIQLRDLLADEAASTRSAVAALMKGSENLLPKDHYADLVRKIESACERLVALMIAGVLYADARQAKYFGDAFQTVASISSSGGGYTVMIALRKYPALLLCYAVGVATLLSGEYHLLNDIAYRPLRLKQDDEDRQTPPDRIYTHSVADSDEWNGLYIKDKDGRRWHTPLSQHLEKLFRPKFSQNYPDDDQYERAFDEFEILWSMLHVEAQQLRKSELIWAPVGCFIWRSRGWQAAPFVQDALAAAGGSKLDWAPYKAGLFGGSHARMQAAVGLALTRLEEQGRGRY